MDTYSSTKEPVIAACGLYCTNCKKYSKGNCPGCKENTKASWCKIRSCCIDKQIDNCAGCQEFKNPKECGKYNNMIAKTIEFFTRTDRSLCIAMIREQGNVLFVEKMASDGLMSMGRQKKTSV